MVDCDKGNFEDVIRRNLPLLEAFKSFILGLLVQEGNFPFGVAEEIEEAFYKIKVGLERKH